MNFHEIRYDDMLNGDGIRCVLFVNLCNHKCEGCHNPQTWVAGGGKFTDTHLDEIINYCKQDYVSGLTLSGGDPLHPQNLGTITKICMEFKKRLPNKTIWLYTGYHYEQAKDYTLVKYLDVMVDGKFVKELSCPSPMWRGSRNQSIIDVQESLKCNQKIIIEL